MKVTLDGATRLKGTVADTPIAHVALSPAIAQHRRYLRRDGLSETCQSCDIVEICGGGSLPHRFGESGFVNPTVYCHEMKRLVTHINSRLREHLSSDMLKEVLAPLPDVFDLTNFELAETSTPQLSWLCASAREAAIQRLRESLVLFPDDKRAAKLSSMHGAVFEQVAIHPGAIAWSNAVLAHKRGHVLLTVDGQVITVNPDYLDMLLEHANPQMDDIKLDVGRNDAWLRAPFGGAIIFEDDELVDVGRPLVKCAMAIVRTWRPALAMEILAACRAIQFVRDPSADPRKIVSFSDNSVPGALYVSISQGDGLIDPYDLADSLIHEHRHQKLYLLERHAPTVESTSVQVVSPWREDLRPPSGLLHAVFVFVELRRFWLYVRDHGPTSHKSRAVHQIADTDLHLKQAFATLKECPLTEIGLSLVEVLRRATKEGEDPNEPGHHHSAIPFIT